MTARTDLTRWNRAGLDRFRYMDGNAAVYMELIRSALSTRFPLWKDVASTQDLETDPEQLMRQYHEKRGEWAWEIARVLARSSHILTEYIDAYANEGFLGTATQWDNVRRMVEMLDYNPAPPASASTSIVLEAKDNAKGVIKAGFQIKHTPEDGGSPVIFETLEDLRIDAALNRLRPAEYNRNRNSLGGNTLLLEGKIKGLQTGTPLVLEDEKSGILRAYLINGIQPEENATRLKVSPRLSHRLQKGYTKAHVKPGELLDPVGPAAKGAEVEQVLHIKDEPDGLLPGMVIYISDGKEAHYRRLIHVRGRRLIFDAGIGPLKLDQARIGLPLTLTVSKKQERAVKSSGDHIYAFMAAGDWSRLTSRKIADVRTDSQYKNRIVSYTVTAARYHPADSSDSNRGYTLLTISGPKGTFNNPQAFLVPPAVPGQWKVDSYIEKHNAHLPLTLTTTRPQKTSAGDLAVVMTGRQLAWTRLAAVAVDTHDNTAELTASGAWTDRGGGDFFLSETNIYSHFQETLRPAGWQENDWPITGRRIPLEKVPDSLEKGRSLLVETTDAPDLSLFTTVAQTEKNAVVLSHNLPEGFTRGNCIIYGNMVTAGHGESRGEKVLGSGDATRSCQSFVFEQKDVSFVPDPEQPSGVRAAIEIRVEDRIWTQVGSLNNSGPTDPHYTVRMTEDGYVKIAFGDGTTGRRLPTGTNNVRITYRQGSGLEGNLPAGSLNRPARPHHLIKGVRQPLAATGGNNMEETESLRENAPATVLTLDRAVCLTDFAYLAMSQSSVWQARAFQCSTAPGRNESIKVVVVPAGGGELGDLYQTLLEFLTARAIPGVEIDILPYQERSFDLHVILYPRSGYDPDAVTSEIKANLQETFCLSKRKLGQDLFISEVYRVVESTEGVEHSRITINRNSGVRRVTALDHEVLTLGHTVIDHEGSASAVNSSAPSAASSADTASPAPGKIIGARHIQLIQGIGPEYAAIFRGNGINTLDDIRNMEPDGIQGKISRVRLQEFRTKAEIVLDLDIDRERAAPLLDRSVHDLLHLPAVILAQQSGADRKFIEDIRKKLRLLQVAIDEKYLTCITLRELISTNTAL